MRPWICGRDVDTAAGQIRVQHGKRDQWRVVGIDPESGALIDHWLERRTALQLGGRHRLFTTYRSNNYGQSMSDRYVRALRDDATDQQERWVAA